MSRYSKLGLLEMFGLNPLPLRARQTVMALRGDEWTPPSRFGVSSLRIFNPPSLGIKMWLRRTRPDRRIPIYNLFNHTQTPLSDGWSVRVTQVRDFRGGRNTYDSHNGTDFAVPVGTEVVSAAPGLVVRVCNEFHRGGLKVVIDHGRGLITTSNHLGRSLVRVGQTVARGEPVALSGASGLDMVAAFPWNVPHVHYNVWLNGEYVDPFAYPTPYGRAESLWVHENWPVPPDPNDPIAADADFEPSAYDPERVQAAIDACLDPELRAALDAIDNPTTQAVDTIFHMNYFPTRFRERPSVYAEQHPRAPMLTLPFSSRDYVGIAHLD